MAETSSIREHMDVKSSDGHHIGRVDRVRGSGIELGRLDSEAEYERHLVPMSWVAFVDRDVHLNMTRESAEARWIEKG
jgi:hypothetical protein